MADFNINVVFNGSYQFEKLQSDLAQTDPLARDYIKNQPDWDNMIFDSVTTDELIMGGETTTWDDGEGTLSTTLPDGGSLQHGKEIFDYYTNVDTVTLVEGDVVCIKQIHGNRKAVKRLDPSQRVDAFSVVGVVTVPTIAVNAVGRVTKIGHVTPYNTASWSDNDSLWVSSANIGKLTNVKPDAGVYSVKVGHVVVSDVSGTIDVRIQVIPKVRDLSDMDGVPLNTEGQFYILQADGTFSANKNINDYYTKTEADNMLDDKVDMSLVGAANGLATLGSDGLVPSTQLPSFVDDIIDAYGEYTDDSDPTTLVELYKDSGKTKVVDKATGKIYLDVVTRFQFRWSGSAWGDIKSGPVQSVNGKTGNVVLAKSDVGLGNVDNTSDANKPISTATQTALNGKVSTTGNETIYDVKTFDKSPKVPNPLTDNDAANRIFVVGVADSAMTKAQQWAENPEDVQVVPGEYSAKHWAAKSEYYFDNLTQNWVGVIIDPTLSSSEPAPKSTVTAYRATELMRTGNLYYHKFGNSRIFNAFQLAIVNRSTRKVAWYLNKNNPSLRADGTISTPDWTTQNIAVIVPNLYRRIKVLDAGTGKYEVAYDIAPFDGAQLWHEESAHSPGFASMDRTLTQLVSVVSDDVRFRGGNNTAGNDLLPSTQLGRPATGISRINFENYAAAAGWETGNIADRTMWHELTALYFANTNIQLDYTTTLTAEGYPQGGLGAGVTNWNSSRWNFRNAYYPIHKVGEGFMTLGCNVGVKAMTDEKYYVGAISLVSAGNLVATGHFAAGAGWSPSYIGYTVQNLQTLAEATITGKTDDNTLTLSADIFTTAGQWYWIKGVTYSYQIPVFFGLEHLYGELWDWVSGVNIEVSATVENGGTGDSKAYVCTDFSKRAATITADYKYIGLTPRTDGYIKELYRDFAIAKVNTGAGSTTFMSDYGYYSSLPSSGTSIRGLLFGAYANNGVHAGVRLSYAYYVPTNASTSLGARLRAKIEK